MPNPRNAARRRRTPRTAAGAPSRPPSGGSSARCRCSLLGAGLLPGPGGRQISYSEFKSAGRGGQVAEVTVGDTTIHGTLKKARRTAATNFTTTRIEDPKLVEELDAAGVKYTGEFVSRWLPEILGWVVPLAAASSIWSFFFRRMGGAEGGVMSFARSKHRDLRRRRRQGELRGRGRRGRGRAGAARDRRVPEERRGSTPTSAAGFPRACCWSARRAPARRCWRARSPARPRCRSSA